MTKTGAGGNGSQVANEEFPKKSSPDLSGPVSRRDGGSEAGGVLPRNVRAGILAAIARRSESGSSAGSTGATSFAQRNAEIAALRESGLPEIENQWTIRTASLVTRFELKDS